MKRLFIFFLLSVKTLISDEYMYPIASLDDTMILMMHQKSIDELELITLDTTNNTTQKLLSTLYLPAHVTVLPSKKAYSFIDRGRMYLKEFLKRTPKALDIYQPICDIQSAQWINDHQVIFSARFKNHYKIFMYDILDNQNQLYSLSSLVDDINYIFPSAIDQETLFCLAQQNETELYEIIQLKINPISWDIALDEHSIKSYQQKIPLNHKKPLCFLKMIDKQAGYVIELTEHIDKTFKFTAYKISIQYSNIHQSKLEFLFEFFIPEHFIIGMSKERFYESLYPLLPNYQEHEIYFTSFNTESKRLKIYVFNQDSKDISLYPVHKTLEHQHTFGPCVINGIVHLGQSL